MNLRERHKQERCGQIVAAAEQLLRSRGMDGFNMRQLAQDAGLSLATPYNLFGSKAEILLALLNRAVDDMERMVAELPSDDPIDLAFALVDASVAIYTRDADYYRSVLLTLNRVTEKRDIEAAIESKAFRSDLYFRLSGVTLDIPPLRERADEIEGLSRAFMAQACARSDRTIVPELSDDAMDALHDHHWPGNIRELRNTIERALLLCRGRVIEAEHINTDDGSRISSPFLRVPTDPAARAAAVPVPQPVPEPEPPPTPGDKREQLRQQLAALEKQELEDALRECGGNQTRAAKLLGISRNTLQTRMDTHGIPRPRKRKK